MKRNVLLFHTYVWYNNTIMSILAKLLSSRTRAEILKILFSLNLKEVHLREIMRRSKLSLGSIQDELKKLQGLDLIVLRRDGNRLYYSANQGHPLFSAIRQLVLRTDGLVDRLKERLAGQEVEAAFIYGSIAKGEEKAASDLDLFIVGSLTLRTLAPRLTGLAEEFGREINPFIISRGEFRDRWMRSDPFISRVLESPKLYIMGGENELEAMGGQRLAQS